MDISGKALQASRGGKNRRLSKYLSKPGGSASSAFVNESGDSNHSTWFLIETDVLSVNLIVVTLRLLHGRPQFAMPV